MLILHWKPPQPLRPFHAHLALDDSLFRRVILDGSRVAYNCEQRERGRQESECSVDAAMTIRRGTGLILVGIACALLVVLIFLVPILFNADRYRPKVISYLEEKAGKKMEIGRLAVTFFPGVAIHVDDFGVKSPPLFPPSYIVKVARIDAQLDVRALLHPRVVIKSLVLEQPVINLVSDPDGPWNFENPGTKIHRARFYSAWSRGWRSSGRA